MDAAYHAERVWEQMREENEKARAKTLIDRLRGHYRTPITDGLGPAGGEEPDNPLEHVRTFQTPPIQHEAAAALASSQARIQELENALRTARTQLMGWMIPEVGVSTAEVHVAYIDHALHKDSA